MAEHRLRTPGEPVELALALHDPGVKAVPGGLVFVCVRLADAGGETVPASGRQAMAAGAYRFDPRTIR